MGLLLVNVGRYIIPIDGLGKEKLPWGLNSFNLLKHKRIIYRSNFVVNRWTNIAIMNVRFDDVSDIANEWTDIDILFFQFENVQTTYVCMERKNNIQFQLINKSTQSWVRKTSWSGRPQLITCHVSQGTPSLPPTAEFPATEWSSPTGRWCWNGRERGQWRRFVMELQSGPWIHFPRDPGSPCQWMIGVLNHLRNA